MKTKLAITVALLVAATGAFAALSPEFADWGNGPVQHIMTKDEQAKWKSITTDADAKAFVDLFWARRDPSPATPRNEAKEAFEARVEWADKNFAFRNTRGSMTDRGRLVILYGQPKRIERIAEAGVTPGVNDPTLDRSQTVQWVYEGDVAQEAFSSPKVTIRIADRLGNGDFKIERSTADMSRAQTRAIEKMVVNPNLTVAPTFAGAAPASRPAAPVVAASAPVSTTLTTEALATAVMDFKTAAKNPFEGKAFAGWGEYVTPAGEYFVPVMVTVPAGAGLAANQDVTFFGVIENEGGEPVLAFEEPAKLSGAKNDLFVAKSLMGVPAGKHRGNFGIAAAGKPVAIASANMTTSGTLDKDATAISPLILAAYVEPMAEAQLPTEPFSFGGVRIVPKADKTFRKTDELWYFFELRNPGLADSIGPNEGTRTGAPAEQLPKVQVKMDVEGKLADGTPVKRAAPLTEVNAAPMKGVEGHYGVGNAIPLESFKPGDYKFTLKVIDTVKKASYTLSDTFRVVE
jgi:GWxTD domain-containing protein